MSVFWETSNAVSRAFSRELWKLATGQTEPPPWWSPPHHSHVYARDLFGDMIE